MPISLVVFDCDGVILDSVNVKTKAFGQTVAEHGPQAVQQLIDYHMAHGGVSRYKKFEWFYREVLGREITDAESQELGERFTKLSYEGVLNADMVPGALEALEALHGKMPMYVASGAPHEELNKVLDARGLSKFFEGIFGSPPGKTELLSKCIELAGADVTETLMIGDSSTDLQAAEENGTQFYGRGNSFANTNHPYADDLSQLATYVQSRLVK